MKTKLLSSVLLMAMPLAASADLLSVEVGAGNWTHDPSGSFKYNVGGSGDQIDLASDLGLKEEDDSYLYALFRHPAPLIPNIKIMNSAMSHAGTGTSTFNFGGTSYSTSYTTKFSLDHTDITAFWNLWDTAGLTLDLGLTARQLDGKVSVDDGSTLTETNIDGTVPMLYASVALSPIDSLRISAEMSYLGAGDTAFTDSTAKISYYPTGLLGFGIEAGVRKMNLELDNQNGNYANADFSGSFIGLTFKF